MHINSVVDTKLDRCRAIMVFGITEKQKQEKEYYLNTILILFSKLAPFFQLWSFKLGPFHKRDPVLINDYVILKF